MKISQGTIPHDYECRPFEVDGGPAGLLFYKDKTSVTAAVLTTLGLCISFYIWSVVSQRFSEERDFKHWSLGGSPKKAESLHLNVQIETRLNCSFPQFNH
jgi:hypothetical protein